MSVSKLCECFQALWVFPSFMSVSKLYECFQSFTICPSHKYSENGKARIEHWLNDIDRGKPKYLEKNMSQHYFVHHKSHTDRSGIECGALRCKSSTKITSITHKISVRTAH